MPRGNQKPRKTHGAFLLGDWLVEPDLNLISLGDRIFLGDGIIAMEFVEAGNYAPTDPPDVATPTGPLFQA